MIRRVQESRRSLGNRDERGAAAIEAVILVPALGMFVLLIVMGGRVAMAHQAVEAAAYDAARAASIERSAAEANTAATEAGRTSLTNQDVNCVTSIVNVNTAGFNTPLGQTGQVTATVTCTVDLSDLSVPGMPGSRTITETATSPVDAFRERR